ncbi:ester cyclase [Sphaerisporangium corydalis]|uniref:Ester cyclase n=1 Tax=Sphaerisporangium corydalis TaxID=1441875 RepID=A0ABV9EKG3_9ACTN|nr:nuclear transport factor 2 family protein [Sphaerisporangium corydalis]
MSDARRVSEVLIRAFNSHDLDAMARCYSDSAVYVSPSGTAEGPMEIASYYGLFLEGFPDLRLTPMKTLVFGDEAFTQWMLSGTQTGHFLMPGGRTIEASGRCVTIRGCSLRTVENGLIQTNCIYYDQAELFSQLGAHLAMD